jgi:hypothetical protein
VERWELRFRTAIATGRDAEREFECEADPKGDPVRVRSESGVMGGSLMMQLRQ